MRHIEFLVYPAEDPPTGVHHLLWGIRVDGRDLRAHAADATRDLWGREHRIKSRAERERFLLTQHDGLPLGEVDDPARHFLGEPGPSFADPAGGTTPVLGCSCGTWGCWPLLAVITAAPATVTWSSFRQPFRKEWGELPLGPYVFDRSAYEAALADPVRLPRDPLAESL